MKEGGRGWGPDGEDGGVCAEWGVNVRDNGGEGSVLIEDRSEERDELDLDVYGDRGDVHGTGGGEIFCRDVL